MTSIFADACYWIALVNRNDQLHAAATAAQAEFGTRGLLTTDEILNEVLTYYCKRGEYLRAIAANVVDAIRADAHVEVVPQTRTSFDDAFALYKNRNDKEYSLTDCRSFCLMRERECSESLTDDGHFEQEGFVALLRV